MNKWLKNSASVVSRDESAAKVLAQRCMILKNVNPPNEAIHEK